MRTLTGRSPRVSPYTPCRLYDREIQRHAQQGKPAQRATRAALRFSPLLTSTNAVVQTLSGSPPWPQARMLLSRRSPLAYWRLSTSRGELEGGK